MVIVRILERFASTRCCFAIRIVESTAAALAASSIVVMLTMPAIGAYADLRAAKKPLLALSTLGCVLSTAALAGCGPGDVAWAVVAVVLSNVFYTYGESLIAAFLPELARQDSMGRVSGWGWSFGYFGGMLTLGLSLAYVIRAQGQGLAATRFVPVTMLITAGVYALAALATFALLRERARPQLPPAGEAGLCASLARLGHTWHQARHFRDFSALLACAVVAASAVLSVRGEEHVIVPVLNKALPGTCTFRRLTGLPCPGCGMTRSFISMAHGRLADAWRFNPAGVVFFAVVVFQIPYRICQIARSGRGELGDGEEVHGPL